MKFALLSIFFFCILFSTFGQSTFQTSYGNVEYDWAFGLTETSSGNYCILGTNGYSPESRDVLLYFVDRNGNLLWTSEIGTDEFEYSTDIIQTNDGGFAITGFTEGGLIDTLSNDVFFLKTDSLGNLEYMKCYGDSSYDRGEKIIADQNGGYYILGSTYSFSSTFVAGLIIKIDSAGNKIWSSSTACTNYNIFNSGLVTSNGKLIVAGQCSTPTNDFTFDNYICEFDTNGTLIWSKRFDSGYNEHIIDLIASDNDGFVTCGNTIDSINYNLTLCSFDSSGNIFWSNRYLSQDYSEARGIALSDNGELLVCGRHGSSTINSQALIARFASNGSFISGNIFGDPTGNSNATDIIKDSENSILISGDIIGFGDFNGQPYLVKTDSTANSGCYQMPVVFNSDPIIYFDSIGGVSQMTIIQDTILNPSTQVFTSQFSLYCLNNSIYQTSSYPVPVVFPNPSDGKFRIEIGNYGEHFIDIYNTIGQKVMQINFGEDFVNVDMSNYLPGIYYFKVDNSKSGKIILTGK